jgi:hypothetical protein
MKGRECITTSLTFSVSRLLQRTGSCRSHLHEQLSSTTVAADETHIAPVDVA